MQSSSWRVAAILALAGSATPGFASPQISSGVYRYQSNFQIPCNVPDAMLSREIKPIVNFWVAAVNAEKHSNDNLIKAHESTQLRHASASAATAKTGTIGDDGGHDESDYQLDNLDKDAIALLRRGAMISRGAYDGKHEINITCNVPSAIMFDPLPVPRVN